MTRKLVILFSLVLFGFGAIGCGSKCKSQCEKVKEKAPKEMLKNFDMDKCVKACEEATK